jgi:hypothetical protein
VGAINWEWSTIFIPLWVFGGASALTVFLVWYNNSGDSSGDKDAKIIAPSGGETD